MNSFSISMRLSARIGALPVIIMRPINLKNSVCGDERYFFYFSCCLWLGSMIEPATGSRVQSIDRYIAPPLSS